MVNANVVQPIIGWTLWDFAINARLTFVLSASKIILMNVKFALILFHYKIMRACVMLDQELSSISITVLVIIIWHFMIIKLFSVFHANIHVLNALQIWIWKKNALYVILLFFLSINTAQLAKFLDVSSVKHQNIVKSV